mgnify:CR=1 FL=1
MLHMDVVQERIEREYNINLIATSPSVVYHVYLTDGTMVCVDNPALLPAPQKTDHIEEPYVRASIMVPKDYVARSWSCVRKNAGYTAIWKSSMTRA